MTLQKGIKMSIKKTLKQSLSCAQRNQPPTPLLICQVVIRDACDVCEQTNLDTSLALCVGRRVFAVKQEERIQSSFITESKHRQQTHLHI